MIRFLLGMVLIMAVDVPKEDVVYGGIFFFVCLCIVVSGADDYISQYEQGEGVNSVS